GPGRHRPIPAPAPPPPPAAAPPSLRPSASASGSTAAAPPRGLPGPPPRPASQARLPEPAPPALPRGLAAGLVRPPPPPVRRPDSFPPSLRGCPPSSSTSTRSRSRSASSKSSNWLNEASFQAPPGGNVCEVDWKSYVLIGDYSSSAQFYVTFAVFVFLYCIAALLLYVGYTNLYRDSRKLPMADFVVTLVATFLWLVSTSAWAKALTDIKIATGPNIVQELMPCNQQGVTCHFLSVTSMGSLNVSVIFGFLNMILWGGNAWFVYKETSLHSPSNTSTSHSQGGVPPPAGI
uniref:Synaptophysin like 1 n=2 Tax=Sus scrofa TaxID=9823 RepID=A0A8D1RY15_PIG